MPATETPVTKIERHTFWKQLCAHPVLHTVEFLLAATIMAVGGELLMIFRYSTVIVPLAVLIGLITMLNFVYSELECNRKISWLPTDKEWNWKRRLCVNGKSYGNYTRLAQKEAELSVLTDIFFVLQLYSDKVKWIVTMAFQAIGVGIIVVYVMALHTCNSHPAQLNYALTLWLLNGYSPALEHIVTQWTTVGVPFIFAFIAFKMFSSFNTDGGLGLLKEKTNAKLLDNHKSRINQIVCAEQLKIKRKYNPEKLREDEIESLKIIDMLDLDQQIARSSQDPV
jgi:hypothetical protein